MKLDEEARDSRQLPPQEVKQLSSVHQSARHFECSFAGVLPIRQIWKSRGGRPMGNREITKHISGRHLIGKSQLFLYSWSVDINLIGWSYAKIEFIAVEKKNGFILHHTPPKQDKPGHLTINNLNSSTVQPSTWRISSCWLFSPALWPARLPHTEVSLDQRHLFFYLQPFSFYCKEKAAVLLTPRSFFLLFLFFLLLPSLVVMLFAWFSWRLSADSPLRMEVPCQQWLQLWYY